MTSTQLFRGLSANSSLDQRLRQYPEEKSIYMNWVVREVDIPPLRPALGTKQTNEIRLGTREADNALNGSSNGSTPGFL